MKMYEREGVPHEHMAFEDNAKCVALLDGRPLNLLSLLDDECAGGAAAKDATYGSKVISAFGSGKGKNPHFGGRDPSGRTFAVKHFAGAVTYETRGFVEKNRDTISTTLSNLCSSPSPPPPTRARPCRRASGRRRAPRLWVWRSGTSSRVSWSLSRRRSPTLFVA
jgi:myosin heavy subunit